MTSTPDVRLVTLAEIEAALAGLVLPATVAVDGSALASIDSATALVLLGEIVHTGGELPGGKGAHIATGRGPVP